LSLPRLVADLVAALADLQRDDLLHPISFTKRRLLKRLLRRSPDKKRPIPARI
jgi:hypothetical protein